MGLLKNDVERPSNETLKTRRILKGLIVIVVVTLIFFGGYVLNGITENNKNQAETSANTKQEVDKILAQEILDNFVYDDYNLLTSENFSQEYRTILAIKHTKGKTRYESCKELFGSNFEKNDSSVGYVNGFGKFANEKPYCYDDKDYIDDNNFYDYSLVETEYKRLFGEPVDLSKEMAFTRYGGGGIIYGYSKNKNGYVKLSVPIGGMWYEEIHTIKEAYMLDDKLHIVFSYFNFFGDLNENGKLSLSNGNDSLNVEVGNITLEDLYDVNIEKTKEKLKYVFDEYDSKLPKYEIVFEKENDNYILHAMYKKN